MKKSRLDRFWIVSWLFHWGTAGLVAMAFAMPFAQYASRYLRMPVHFWHELHVSVGTAILTLAVIRLALAGVRPSDGTTRFSSAPFSAGLQIVLLGMLVLIGITGLYAFRQPALGLKIKLFGLWPYPEVRSFVSSLGQMPRPLHSIPSYAFLAILAVHVWIGIRRDPMRRQRLVWKKLRPW